MTVQLRPGQDTWIEGLRTAFRRHRRVLGVAPCGFGKTICFAAITHAAAARGNRVTIVAHRSEIIDQIGNALNQLGIRHGRIQPGHTQTEDPVQIAMVQTLARRIERVPECSLLVVDEAHHSSADTYIRILDAWPRCKVLGVTATPKRLDGRGMDEAFDALVLGPGVHELIADGFLAEFDYLAPPQKVDLSGIKTRMGDFAIDQLAEVMDQSTITGDAVAHYRDHLQGRPAIAFCVTVAHAEHVAEQFAAAGFRAASVDGGMARGERARRVEAIGSGDLQVLTSCDLISEGFDVPVVAGAILLRPTKSLALHIQQIGRALRPKPDGSRALILDHVGNVHTHGLPDANRKWTLAGREKMEVGPTRRCGECYRVFAAEGPAWRLDHDCQAGNPPGCVLEPEEETAAGVRELPRVVEGQLTAITPSPEWTGGLSITQAKGPDWKILLARADTFEKLRAIASARGYKPGWAYRLWEERRARRRAPSDAAGVPFALPPPPEPSATLARPEPYQRATVRSMFDAALSVRVEPPA